MADDPVASPATTPAAPAGPEDPAALAATLDGQLEGLDRRAGRDRAARRAGARRGGPPRAEARPGGGAGCRPRRPRDARGAGRGQRPARLVDAARHPDGSPARRPDGQAEDAGALSRRAGARSARRSTADGRRDASVEGASRGLADDDARGRPGGAGGPGGPPPRHRAGDARRPRPEPDEHRPPGPDRGAAARSRPGGGARRGPRADGDGPADAGGDEDLHLRRPAHGPRRPGAGPDAAPRRPRSQPAGAGARSSSTRWAPTGASRWSSRRAVFRVADETLAGLAQGSPERVTMSLDWGDGAGARRPGRPRGRRGGPRGGVRAPTCPTPCARWWTSGGPRSHARGIVAQLTLAIRREVTERGVAAGGSVEFDPDGQGVVARFPLPAPPGG